MTVIPKAQVSYPPSVGLVRPRLRLARWTGVVACAVVMLGVALRLYSLDAPLMDARVNESATIARNFAAGAMNILYPQVDGQGYTAGPLQAYPYLVAVLYRLFGVHEVFGRLMNVGIYALSAGLLYVFSRQLYNAYVAVWATIFYAVTPLGFELTRAFQADALAALGALASLYGFWMWIRRGHGWLFVLSTLCLTLTVLVEPLSLSLALPLLYLSYRRYGERLTRQPLLWLVALIVLTAAGAWHVFSLYVWSVYRNALVWTVIALPAPATLLPMTQTWLTQLTMQVATPAGLALLLVGVFVAPRRQNRVLHWWALALGAAALITTGSDQASAALSFVFIAVVWMACAADFLWHQRVVPPLLMRAAVMLACLSLMAFSVWQLNV